VVFTRPIFHHEEAGASHEKTEVHHTEAAESHH